MNTTHISMGTQNSTSDKTSKENENMKPTETKKTEISQLPTSAVHGSESQYPILTERDLQFKLHQEARVSEGLEKSIQTATDLYELYRYKGGIIWMSKYDKFADYVFDTFGLKSSQTSDLMRTAKFIEDVKQANSALADSNALPIKFPKSETQVRALREVKEEYRLDCWKGIVAHRDPEVLTANDVRAEVRVYMDRKGIEPKKKFRPSCLGRINNKISELSEVLEKHPNPEKFAPLIQQLKMLVNSEVQIDAIPAESDPVPIGKSMLASLTHHMMASETDSPAETENTPEIPSQETIDESVH